MLWGPGDPKAAWVLSQNFQFVCGLMDQYANAAAAQQFGSCHAASRSLFVDLSNRQRTVRHQKDIPRFRNVGELVEHKY